MWTNDKCCTHFGCNATFSPPVLLHASGRARCHYGLGAALRTSYRRGRWFESTEAHH
jgi:hypothetical protein